MLKSCNSRIVGISLILKSLNDTPQFSWRRWRRFNGSLYMRLMQVQGAEHHDWRLGVELGNSDLLAISAHFPAHCRND